jgi:hypothetical protein
MHVSSIGIQIIMPKSGSSPQQSANSQAKGGERETDDARSKPAPPPPGMGKFVDKTV